MTHCVHFQPRRLDTGERVDFWFSDGYFVTPSNDAALPDTAVRPMLVQPLLFRRWVGKELFGAALPDLGKIVVVLDEAVETAVFDPNLEWGRAPVQVWDCSAGRLDTAPVLMTAEVLRRPGRRGAGVDIQFEVVEAVQALKVPLQTAVYGGTGGAEGDVAMTDKPRPFLVGRVEGLEPARIDAALNLYQVHNGPVDQIDFVREALQSGEDSPPYNFAGDVGADLEAAVPAPGTYLTDLERGLFRTGQAFGTIRCDVVNGPTHTAGMVRGLLEAGGVAVNTLCFDNHAVAFPYAAGWYSAAPKLTRWDLALNLVQGLGSWLGQGRDGRYEIGALDVPGDGDTVSLALPETLIAARRETAYLEPLHRVVVSVDGQEFEATAPDVLAAYPNVAERTITGFVLDGFDLAARALAARAFPSVITRFELYGLEPHRVTFAGVVALGGITGRVVGVEVDRVTGRTQLDLWRRVL